MTQIKQTVSATSKEESELHSFAAEQAQAATPIQIDYVKKIEDLLKEVVLHARKLPNSDELALFTQSIMTALREIKDVKSDN